MKEEQDDMCPRCGATVVNPYKQYQKPTSKDSLPVEVVEPEEFIKTFKGGNNMNKYQLFAVNHFLDRHPKDASFEDIVRLVDLGEDDLVPHREPYAKFWEKHVSNMLIEMVGALEETFGDKNER